VNLDVPPIEQFVAPSSPSSVAAPIAESSIVTAARSVDPPVQPKPATPPDPDEHVAVFAGHSQWLEAYARGDQRMIAALTTAGFSLRDERAGGAGTPNALTSEQISDVRIDIAGAGAVLTARVRSTADGEPNDALLSEVWVRDEHQQWALMGVRITPVNAVRRPGR